MKGHQTNESCFLNIDNYELLTSGILGNENLQWHIRGVVLHPLSPGHIGIHLEMLVFVEEAKTGEMAKNP